MATLHLGFPAPVGKKVQTSDSSDWCRSTTSPSTSQQAKHRKWRSGWLRARGSFGIFGCDSPLACCRRRSQSRSRAPWFEVKFPVSTLTRVVKLSPRNRPCGRQMWTLIVCQRAWMSTQQHNHTAVVFPSFIPSYAIQDEGCNMLEHVMVTTGMKTVLPWRACPHVNILFPPKKRISEELWKKSNCISRTHNPDFGWYPVIILGFFATSSK